MSETQERTVTFERAGRRFALPAGEVSEIAPDRPAQPVPLAPAAVAGCAIERGRLLTVLELDSLLRIQAEPDGRTFLIVLAPPWAHLALRVRAEVRLGEPGRDERGAERIDVARMVESVEAAIAAAARRRRRPA